MTVDNQNSDIEHTFPNGLQLTVGEIASGQFGWWIDAPGSELRSIVVDNHTGTVGFKANRALLSGEEPTRDAAIVAAKKAYKNRYGS
jgi:hypothetical protein